MNYQIMYPLNDEVPRLCYHCGHHFCMQTTLERTNPNYGNNVFFGSGMTRSIIPTYRQPETTTIMCHKCNHKLDGEFLKDKLKLLVFSNYVHRPCTGME